MSTVPAVDVPPGTFGVPSPKRTFAAIFIGSQQASHEAEREANPRGYSRRSCFVLDLEHPLRRAAIALVTSAWFDRLILVIIIANCVQIAIAGPSSAGGASTPLMNSLELFFTSAFTAEIGARVLATGLYEGRAAFLKDKWHLLDTLVVVTSWISIGASGSEASSYGALRALRVLRPLRTVTRVRGMRVLVLSMLRSLPKLVDVFTISAFAAAVFAVIGMQLFKGSLHYRCVPAALAADPALRLGFTDYDRDVCDPLDAGRCEARRDASGRAYVCAFFSENPNFGLTSFDDLGHALLLVFVAATLEGWADVMYMVGRGSERALAVLFFVALVVLLAFCCVNLFLAVIFAAFQEVSKEDRAEEEARARERANRLHTANTAVVAAARLGAERAPGEVKAEAAARPAAAPAPAPAVADAPREAEARERALAAEHVAALNDAPVVPSRGSIARLRPIVEHPRFASAFLLLILLNAAFMVIDGYVIVTDARSVGLSTVSDRANVAFTALFTVELLLKYGAYGPCAALRVPWTAADTLIVSLSWVELGIQLSELSGVGFSLTVFRTFRLLRLMKLARSLPGLQRVIRMVSLSLAKIGYLTALFLLLLFVATLLGQELFYGEFGAGAAGFEGEPLTQFNFDSFGWGAITVFVVMTGENWNELMYAGVGSVSAAKAPTVMAFMVIFVMIGRFYVLNLFIAVLLANVSDVKDAKAASERALRASAVGKLALLTARKQKAPDEGGDGRRLEPLHTPSSSSAELLLRLEQEAIAEAREREPVWERRGGMRAVDFESVAALVAEEREARALLLAAPPARRRRPSITIPGLGAEKRRGGLFGFGGPGYGARKLARGARRGRARSTGGESVDSPTRTGARRPSGASADDSRDDARPAELALHRLGTRSRDDDETATTRAAAAEGARRGSGAPDWLTAVLPSWSSESQASATVAAPARPARAASEPRGLGARAAVASAPTAAPRPPPRGPPPPPPPRRPAAVVQQASTLGALVATRRDQVLASARASFTAASQQRQSTAVLTAVRAREERLPSARLGMWLRAGWRRVLDFLRGPDLVCGVLGPAHPLRATCARLVFHPWFERAIIALIALSSLALAIDTPAVTLGGATRARAFEVADWVFTCCFFAEMVVKVVALGVLRAPGAYLKSAWNWLDGLLVVASVASSVADAIDAASTDGGGGATPAVVSALRTLRLLRALRPLRALAHHPGLKLVVNSLIDSLPEVGNVLTVFSLLAAVFAILGVQLFAHKLSSCSDARVTTKAACVGVYVDADGVARARGWYRSALGSFDDFGQALVLLFELATAEMWPDVMLLVIGSRGVDVAPSLDVRGAGSRQLVLAAYFVCWQLVGSFFALNLFVGVVIDNFNALKEAQDGSGFLTEAQRAWSDSLHELAKLRALRLPVAPKQRWRAPFFRLASHRAFQSTMVFAVVANIAVLCADSFPGSAELSRFVAVANLVFTAVFSFELVLKVAGLGVKIYWHDRWNQFDALVLAASYADLLVELATAGTTVSFSPAVLRTLRVFRIVRMLRLVRSLSSIRNLLVALLYALPALANVGGLLLLLLYVYAVLGANLFYAVAWRDGGFVGEDVNFRDFPSAFLLLFRALTGESWNGLMHDTMVQEDARGLCSQAAGSCVPLHEVVPIIYFFSFVMLSLICLNLVIAVILEQQAAMSNASRLTARELEHFQEVWSDFDRKGSYWIPTVQLPELLWNLDPPLGLSACATMRRADMLKFLVRLDVPEHNGLVHMHETLIALARSAHGTALPLTIFTTELNRLIERALRARGIERVAASRLSAAQVFAALLLQRRWRQLRLRKIFSKLTDSLVGRRPYAVLLSSIPSFAVRVGVSIVATYGLRVGLSGGKGRGARPGQLVLSRSLRALVGEEGPITLSGGRRRSADAAHAAGSLESGSPQVSPQRSSQRVEERSALRLLRAGVFAKVRGPDGSLEGSEWIAPETLARASLLLVDERRHSVLSPTRALEAAVRLYRPSSTLTASGAGGGAAADSSPAAGDASAQPLAAAAQLSAERDEAVVAAEMDRATIEAAAEEAKRASRSAWSQTAQLALVLNRHGEQNRPRAALHAASADRAFDAAARAEEDRQALARARALGALPTISELFDQPVTPEHYRRGDARLARGMRSVRRAYASSALQRLQQTQTQASGDVLRWLRRCGCCPRAPPTLADVEASAELSSDDDDVEPPTQRERYARTQLREEAAALRPHEQQGRPWWAFGT